MAQNKSKKKIDATAPPKGVTLKQEASTAGAAKQRRIKAQKDAELKNKKLREGGLPTPWEIAKEKRHARRHSEGKHEAYLQRVAQENHQSKVRRQEEKKEKDGK